MSLPKVILFDVDGVLIRQPHYFSQELEKNGYQKAEENFNAFFGGPIGRLCLEGKADPEKEVRPFLENFGWDQSAKEYWSRQFQFERQFVDEGLLKKVAELRKEGLGCFLVTDQMENRAQFLLKELNFENIFDGHFISCRVGARKIRTKFWDQVIKSFPKIQPREIIFFDDQSKNLDKATGFGLETFLFEDPTGLEQRLDSLKRV